MNRKHAHKFLSERTPSGDELHDYIMDCAKAGPDKEWSERIESLKEYFRMLDRRKHGWNPFLEISINGCTHLRDIVHLVCNSAVGGKKVDSETRAKRCIALFDIFIKESEKYVNKNEMAEMVMALDDSGFSLPQTAVATGSLQVAGRIFPFVRKSVSPDEYKELILVSNDNKWNLFHTSAKTKAEMFDFLVREFSDVFGSSQGHLLIRELLFQKNTKDQTPMMVAQATTGGRVATYTRMRDFTGGNGYGGARVV